MDFIRLIEDHGVTYITEGVNVSPGWVNMKCVWCPDDPSEHLGWNLSQEYFSCWRCGWHQTYDTLARLLNIDREKVGSVVRRYGGTSVFEPPAAKVETNKLPHRLPTNVGPLNAAHIKYIADRAFDPQRLEHDWQLLGTGPISLLTALDDKAIDFKFRILIPIIWNNQQVSYQGRDITGLAALRYLTCPEVREIIHHKTILGGRPVHWTDTGLIVEGYFDVFRFGLRAACTFGINYTPEQVRVIARLFKRVAVAFDDEPQAVAQANKLVSELKFRGRDAWRVPIIGDPGAMKQDDADHLVKNIFK